MEAQRFDTIAKTWGRPPRRRLLGGLTGSALGALAVSLGVTETKATPVACRHVGKRCKHKSQCCSARCKHGRCRAHDTGICKAGQDACDQTSLEPCGANGTASCFCYVTTGRASFCGSGTTGASCTHDTDCVTDKGAGAACVSCAALGQNVCVARCPVPD